MTPLKVLLVEDDPDYPALLRKFFAQIGKERFELVHVTSLQAALAVDFQQIHVAVLDLTLPDSSGFETFEKISAHAPSIPILILSGFHDEALAIRAVQHGAQDYLVKGQIDGQELVRAIQYAIERKRIQIELIHSEERLKLAVDAGHVGIWNWDLKTDRVSWGGHHHHLFGLQDGTFDGTFEAFERLCHPEDIARIRAEITRSREQRGEFTCEFRNIWPDRTVHWILSKGRFYYGPGGQAERMAGVSYDITERKLLEQQLLQAQKMEAIGQLAGGIAHDFNNLLTIILGRTELALRKMPPTEPLREKIQLIHSTAERAASLTRQLLAFSRRQVLEPTSLDLNEVVKSMGEMLRRLIGEDIRLELRLASDLRHVKADPAKIEQVIANLATNARDAMLDGGELKIETSNAVIDESYARQNVGITAGRYVMLAVTDSGSGMDAETQRHLFEPFFTTKEQGKGTGLGLSTIYGIVKQSNGHILVDSAPGRGTSMRIYLPEAASSSQPGARISSSSQSAVGVETILVVEDEEGVRELVCDLLRDQGYTVLEAPSGSEAKRIVSMHKGRLNLMLSDVVMPEISGPKLAEQLQELKPGLKVIFMSGYTDNALGRHNVLNPGTAFIEKPFSQAALIRKVRQVLETEA